MIFVNKGIEEGSGVLTLEIILDTLSKDIAKQATFLVRPRPSILDLPLLDNPNNSPLPVRSILRKRNHQATTHPSQRRIPLDGARATSFPGLPPALV